MTKPVIVTRIGKGSELTFGEGDANFTNLQNATVSVAGDSGTTQVLDLNDTLTVAGGTGLSSVMTTDTVTLNLDNTAVTPNSYTYASITVDQQGRITSASSGATPLVSGGALGTPSSGTLTNCTFPTLNQNTTGSAATLTTPRNINGVAFDGSAAITVTADAGTLSGSTLASGVTASSLTSLGTIATGVWNGSSISTTYTDAKVTSVNGSTGAITGLATTASLSSYQATSEKNQANGYAGLDAGGKVASAQLPSYVDDVVESANQAALPVTGETSKIYVTLDNNKIYRWSGSAYVEISASPGSTDSVTEGSTNLYFTNTRARDAFSASTGITITNGAIATTITQYTDALARAAVSVTDAGGDGSLSYNNTTGVFTYTGPSAAEVRAHVSAGTGITITDGAIATTITQYADSNARSAISVTDSGGDGSLGYNNTTGVITYTGPGTTDYRAAFTAGTGITITSGVIASTVSDTNTTYGISAETATGGVNLRLTGSDASTDDVKLAQGSNITLTRTDANTITIAGSAGGISDVVQDTTPQLGGSLDVNGQSIVSVSNGNIVLAPNGTGRVNLDGVLWPAADGTNGQVLTTNGSGSASWSAPAGGGNATVYVQWGDAVEIAGGAQRQIPTELYDSAGIFSISSTYNFTLPAGTYVMSMNSRIVSKSSNWQAGDFQWTSVSGDSSFSPFTVGGATGSVMVQVKTAGEKFVLTQSSTFYMQPPAETAFYNSSSVPKLVRIEKIA
jgi:hypothetical protein